MSVIQDDDVSKQPLNSSATNGLSVEVEGFQAQAATAGEWILKHCPELRQAHANYVETTDALI